ncbi:DUF3549 family protein [Aestuariirhabdus sp. Z084]|uniref:DUF3549 family protein n=1 Tax=Aestuariirhabdus haliotis TaxID=2918751 RepID=UPI00201B3CE8|nr:DUF3549 family protein [Aestuariirhabdus haliotis]MCL6417643.1 DUF3549 family protein [Aestuariirhabdus haliotis]MCL6421569.1 DUF3549 family protein [Aestuariirhabdus haliotis]
MSDPPINGISHATKNASSDEVGNSMSNIGTLTEFLEQSDIRLQVFDMGRRLRKLPRQQLLGFELGQTPYPYPYLQQAWLGFVLSDTRQGALPVIWFLKFPLDREGKLVASSRDDFLLRIIKTVGEKLELGSVDPTEDALKETPYAFKPEEERMACFHARASRILALPPSTFYQPAHDYFAGQAFDHWQGLGLQGIADICARLEQDDNARHLRVAVATVPAVPLELLCCCLENEAIDHKLTTALVDRAQQLLTKGAPNALIAALLRGISHSKAPAIRQQLIDQLLDSAISNDGDILAAIASRCWEDLEDPLRLQSFLEQLATNHNGPDFFNRVLVDLLMLPNMAPRIMAQFRNPERSEALGKAIGDFIQLGAQSAETPTSQNSIH